jgi:tetratricopeptide (TPR) repeat protein
VRSLEIRRKQCKEFPDLQPLWAGLAFTYSNWGRLHWQLGRAREAEEAYRQASDSLQKVVAIDPKHPSRRQDLAFIRSVLAWLHLHGPAELRDAPRALSLIQKALESEPENATYLTVRGMAHYRLGGWNSALTDLRQARLLYDRTNQPLTGWVSDATSLRLNAEHHARKGDVLNGFFRAMAHWQLGDKDEARRQYDAAACWLEMQANPEKEDLRLRDEATSMLGIEKGTVGMKREPTPKPRSER